MVRNEEEKITRINLQLPQKDKDEWERFSKEIVHASSMSQMIRDAVREYMQKKGQPKQASAPEPVAVQNDLSEKRIEDIVTKKLEELLSKREADRLFNQRKYPEAVNAYLETVKLDNKEKAMPDLENAEVIMKLAYSCINVKDIDNAKKYLQEAKRIYTRLKKEAEIKVIDSTIDKLNASMSRKD